MKDWLFNSEKTLGTSRYAWIDYAKGICIILVTFRHVQEGLHPAGTAYPYPFLKMADVFFFSFRMPLFFIVSGIFLAGALAKKGVQHYLSSRFKTIFYPLLIWGTIQVTLQLIFKGYVNAQREPIDYLNLLIKPREIEQFWYLHTLFLVGSLYAIMTVYAKFNIWQQLFLGAVLYAITGYFRYNNLFEHLFILDVFFYYIFFAVGDLFGKWILDQKNFKIISARKTFLIFLPIFLLVEGYFAYLNLSSGWDYYVQNRYPAFFLFVGLLGGAFLIHCSFLLQKLDKVKFIRVIGYHSLYIYVIHLAVTAGTRIFFMQVLNVTNLPFLIIISTILGIGVPIIIYNITDKLGMWWLFTLKNPEPGKVRSRSFWKIRPGKIAPEEPVQAINPQVIEKT
jgi:fucose 4-O-acetylase-like acetyltransferase